jgi:hypothetical protein
MRLGDEVAPSTAGAQLIQACLRQIPSMPTVAQTPDYSPEAKAAAESLFVALFTPGGVYASAAAAIASYFWTKPKYTGLVCSTALVNTALATLRVDPDPTVTTARLTAAGELLLRYKGFAALPGDVFADQASLRERAAAAVAILGSVNPTLAASYLGRAIESGEGDSFTVGTIVRSIGALLAKEADYIETGIRNRAIGAVEWVATSGLYKTAEATTAVRIYEQIKQWYGTPVPVDFKRPEPMPTTSTTKGDVIDLQKAVNRVAAAYQITGVTVTGVVDAATTEAVVALAWKFTAASLLAAQAYVEVVAAPTADTVLALAPRISRDLNALADQLGIPRQAASGFRWWYVALPLALAAAGGGTYYLLRRYRRTRKPLGSLFICPEEEVGCSGPYEDRQWEDVLRYAAKTGGVSVYRGVRRPDFLVKRFQ